MGYPLIALMPAVQQAVPGIAALGGAATKAPYLAATSVASTGLSAYSAYQQGQAQQSWNQYNAEISRQKAASERMAAEASAERMRMQNEQLKARQRIALNTSGVTMAGTPTDLLADTTRLQQLDIDTLLWNAGAKSDYSLAGANLLERQGEVAGRTGLITAGTNLLTGTTMVGQQYAENERWRKLMTGK